jgi:hypothetical protein
MAVHDDRATLGQPRVDRLHGIVHDRRERQVVVVVLVDEVHLAANGMMGETIADPAQ